MSLGDVPCVGYLGNAVLVDIACSRMGLTVLNPRGLSAKAEGPHDANHHKLLNMIGLKT